MIELISSSSRLNGWVTALQTVQHLTASGFDGTVGPWPLNRFAKEIVSSHIKSNPPKFSAVLDSSFPGEGLSGATFSATDTFTDVVNACVQPYRLDTIVLAVVQAGCGLSCTLPDGSLDETKTLAQAFPTGTAAWDHFVAIIQNSNLCAVIGDPSATLNSLKTMATTKTLGDLVTFLFTVT